MTSTLTTDVELSAALEEVESEIRRHEQELDLQLDILQTVRMNRGLAPQPMTASTLNQASSLPEWTKHHFLRLRRLRYLKNSLIPISRLPPEILSQIFFAFCALVKNQPRAFGRYRREFEWLSVAHVCHEWRDVALSTPLFWSNIRLGNLSDTALATILARSQQAPLQITSDFDETRRSRVTCQLLILQEHMARVESLDMCLPPHAFQDTITPSVSPSQMQRLVLKADSDHYTMEDAPLLRQYSFPALKELELRGYRLSWHLSSFPHTLTHMSIDYSNSTAPSRCSVAEVVAAIRPLSKLQDLRVQGMLSKDPVSSAVLPSTSLTNLKYLLIKATPAANAHFLDCFRIPSTASVTIAIERGSTNGLGLLVPSMISKMTYGLSQENLKNPVDEVHIRPSLVKLESTLPTDPTQSRASFSIAFDRFLHIDGEIVAQLFAKLPLGDTQKLVLQDIGGRSEFSLNRAQVSVTTDGWIALFNVLSRVVDLELNKISPPLDALRLLQTRRDDVSHQSYVFPKLRNLKLENMSLTRNSIASELAKAITARAQEGAVLDKLVMRQCWNTGEGLAALREVVDVDAVCTVTDDDFSDDDYDYDYDYRDDVDHDSDSDNIWFDDRAGMYPSYDSDW
ncbi:hypothetical protein EIP91_008365 [Steccherinum ochraceum]|uniref:F-box domain-containing protein n=1 Tax=Steccherinum ochraceum TaxID=92696 RepID=A0A4R0RB75_9APHY|nr:hypothetical protein EIP91_008365 [Steccherinum ochraceum]